MPEDKVEAAGIEMPRVDSDVELEYIRKYTPKRRSAWEQKFRLLAAYQKRTGTARIKQRQGKLGQWATIQGNCYSENRLSQYRIQCLNSINFNWPVRKATTPNVSPEARLATIRERQRLKRKRKAELAANEVDEEENTDQQPVAQGQNHLAEENTDQQPVAQGHSIGETNGLTGTANVSPNTDQQEAGCPDETTNRGSKLPFPMFPQLLYDLLEGAEEGGYEHIISWCPGGKSFNFAKPNGVAKRDFMEVLKKEGFEFRTYSLRHFVDQIHIYGFERITTGKLRKGQYRHKLFVRGEHSMLEGKTYDDFQQVEHSDYLVQDSEGRAWEPDEPRSIATDLEVSEWDSSMEDDGTHNKRMPAPIFRKMVEQGNLKKLHSDIYVLNRDDSRPLSDLDRNVLLAQNDGFVHWSDGRFTSKGRNILPCVYYAHRHGYVISVHRRWTKTFPTPEDDVIGDRICKGRTKYHTRSYHVVKGCIDSNDYVKVCLRGQSCDGQHATMEMGTVVLAVFVENRPFVDGEYLTVQHDIARGNNRLENLRWLSMSDQNRKANKRAL